MGTNSKDLFPFVFLAHPPPRQECLFGFSIFLGMQFLNYFIYLLQYSNNLITLSYPNNKSQEVYYGTKNI